LQASRRTEAEVTGSRTVSSSVEVAVDPLTAFTVFTDEIDCWWVPGPINFYDSSRAYGRRIEPGVGGRVMEVYDDASGDGLELGRISVWEPGSRIVWNSSLDDVEIDVQFRESDGGTLVLVQATIPEGGADRGGSSWVRVTPAWLGAWVAKRHRTPHEPLRPARLAIAVHYSKPVAAARWLRDVFGLEPTGDIADAETDDEHTWIEFHVGNSSLMVFRREGDPVEGAPTTHTPWVFVDDLDAHFAHAKEGGARIVQDIQQLGARTYETADLEGNVWTFAQAGPRMR
ncbi:MAG: VOC family protein, partial [Acidimicrobiia bacterium]